MRHLPYIFLIVLVLGLSLACGPSLRRTYQSDNAFERCFDFDYNPRKSVGQKRACWESWLARYVYNQPADKIAYAELRLEEIGQGVSVPGPPGSEGAFDERPLPPAPPADAGPAEPGDDGPGTAAMVTGDAGPHDEAGVAEPPEQECEERCKSSFTPCAEECGKPGPASCRAACDAGYRGCMRGCFGDD